MPESTSTTPPLPPELPVLPLRGTVAFPLSVQPLAVNRPVSVESVNRALAGDRMLLLVLQDGGARRSGPRPGEEDWHRRHHPPDGAQPVGSSRHRRGPRARARRRRQPHRAVDARGDPRGARAGGSLRRSGCIRAAAAGAGRSRPDACERVFAGASRDCRRDRGSPAPGVPARKPARHAGRRQAEAARGRHAAVEARDGIAGPRPRDRAARSEGEDRVAGAAGDVRRAAAVLPAPAAQGHPGRARRGRR